MADDVVDLPVEEKEEEEFSVTRTMAPIHDPVEVEDEVAIEDDDGLHILKPKVHPQPHEEDDEAEFTNYMFNGYDEEAPYSYDANGEAE